MGIRNATPLKFSPVGLSDAIDGTNVFAGACAALQNLIPDPSTANLWQGRPASNKIVDFNASGGPFSSGFSSGFQFGFSPFNAGFISAMEVFGDYAYGMVATAQFNTDVPFAFNLLTKSFTLITGVTAANTPTQAPSSGPWTPPSMDLIGTKIIVTHPGFNFAGGFAFGVLDISNVSVPTWTAQNTTTNSLPALPQWVKNFNGRAYFLVNPATGQPGAYFSDVLVPTSITNANQVLTFDDSQKLTCAAGLGLFNQLGGQIQSLIVFKGVANIYQVTGDAALSNLAKNSLNVATGTNSPLSVTTTPRGLTFLAPDGLRIIDFNAKISDPIGVDGQGVNVPFIFSQQPSRAQAASNQNVLRISVQNGNAPGTPNQEFWFDISRHKWSGPHTFPASMIAPYNNTFIIAPINVLSSLWQSDVTQSVTSTFVENGQQMVFDWSTCLLPDTSDMAQHAMVESTLRLQLVGGQAPVNVQARDQNGAVLNSVLINSPGQATLWGQFNWGQAVWGGAQNALFPRPLDWTAPLEFQRLQIRVTGNLILGFKIGDLDMRYQRTGYLIPRAAA